MSWSDSLAATAQSWANMQLTRGACAVEAMLSHSPAALARTVGENVALMPTTFGSADAVSMWVAEADCYNYAAGTCASTCRYTYRGLDIQANTCGHYTQVVWNTSTEVGCAVADCPHRAGYADSSVWVCQYTPPGNTGRRPY